MARSLIVTADDFGRCLPINEAVEDAHRRGILTAASLMIGGKQAQDAIARAKTTPALAIGLHVTLVDGEPVLPPSQIPDLVEKDGRFSSRVAVIGARIYFSRAVQSQVRAELRAQFERFQASGLALDHVDSHHHYHLHPTIFALMLDLAVEFGAKELRIPFEPPLTSWRARRDKILKRAATGVLHWRANQRMRKAAERAGLVTNDHVFGFADSGAMDEAHLLDFLDHLPEGVSEFYGHPAVRLWDDHPLPADYRPIEEYRALISPLVAKKIGQGGIALTNFSHLASESVQLIR